jgi:enoyl-CoA hydratase/carnithine racemase
MLGTPAHFTSNNVLILSGSEPGSFCAGADLAEVRVHRQVGQCRNR